MSEPNPPSQPTPPAPPAPPAPPVPQVPQYGEYAPDGYVAPQPAADQAPPGYTPQPYGSGSYPAQPGPRRRKTWDLVITIVLLALGFFGMLIGLLYAGVFSDPVLMDQVAQGAGLPGFTGEVGSAGPIIAISHVLLYLLALGGAIPLILTKRVAFWAPLAAGIIAAIIFWSTVMAVFLSDPGFVATYS